MKPYKKYGDIYSTTAQVRKCLKNKPYGDNEGLRDFWCDRIQVLIKEDYYKNRDCIAGYCEMFYLSYVLEKIDVLRNWRLVVLAHRQQYKYSKP